AVVVDVARDASDRDAAGRRNTETGSRRDLDESPRVIAKQPLGTNSRHDDVEVAVAIDVDQGQGSAQGGSQPPCAFRRQVGFPKLTAKRTRGVRRCRWRGKGGCAVERDARRPAIDELPFSAGRCQRLGVFATLEVRVGKRRAVAGRAERLGTLDELLPTFLLTGA